MKKLLFLLLGLAVAVSASANVTKASIQKNVKPLNKNTVKGEYVVRKAAPGTVGTPYTGMIKGLRADVPEGYAMVTFTAGDVWEDGSGYQMLLDADATAFGTIFPETGPMNTGGDVSAEVYANFEYKIPENADGALSTTNIIINNSVSILIPAGTYDWCITNPTPGDRMWIASDNGTIGGRADDFEFKSECTYLFTVSLGGSNDKTDLEIIDPNAPVVPEIAVTPGSTDAYVEWAADKNATGYNLRWRPYTDTSGGAFFTDLNNDDFDALIDQLGDWYIFDADGDGDYWGIGYGEAGEAPDYCFQSDSYYSGTSYDPDQYLVSPEVNLGGVLRFRMKGVSSWPDNIRIYVVPDLDNITSLDDLANYPLTDDLSTPGEWTEFEFSLSEWEGTKGRIAFRHYNSEDNYYVKIDDIFIGDPDDGIIEPAPWVDVTGLTDPNYTIEGLTPEIAYEVQVQAYNDDTESDWCEIVKFTTLRDVPDVYILGEVNNQTWAPNAGTKMDYNAEDNLYTATVTFDGRGQNGENYFSFTTELAENNDDGGWAYIAPFRIGAVSNGNFVVEDQYLNQPLDITYGQNAFQIPAGEYKLTVDLTSMKLIIEKLTPAHDYEVGDVNHDHAVNIADVTALIDYLLGSGSVCETCANVNGDEGINIADVTALIDLLLAN